MKALRAPLFVASRVTLAALALLAQSSAQAHGASAGMAGFGGGLIHPLITPAHLLLLLALGLWLGQQRPLTLRLPALAFVPGAAIGLLVTTRFTLPPAWQAVLLCMALVAALMLATSTRLPSWATLPLFAGAGLALGLDSGVDSADSPTALAITLLATWLGLGLCLVNFAYYTSLLSQRKWVQIGVRVAGSWLAAICLLVLAFAFKSNLAA
jgi:hydrogenase/urease accessory protein HupE